MPIQTIYENYLSYVSPKNSMLFPKRTIDSMGYYANKKGYDAMRRFEKNLIVLQRELHMCDRGNMDQSQRKVYENF